MNQRLPSHGCRRPDLGVDPGLLTAGLLLALVMGGPAFAQRCTTNQNGQTICCDNNGNCYSK